MLEGFFFACRELRRLNVGVVMGLMYSCSVHNYTWGNTFDKEPIVIYQCLSSSISVVTMQQLMSPWISTVTVNRIETPVLQKHKSLPPAVP